MNDRLKNQSLNDFNANLISFSMVCGLGPLGAMALLLAARGPWPMAYGDCLMKVFLKDSFVHKIFNAESCLK